MDNGRAALRLRVWSCYADVPALDEESCISLSEGEVKSQELAPRN
ncbi:hypothetical protein AB7M49_004268 [Bradyrhizobium elkanii]